MPRSPFWQTSRSLWRSRPPAVGVVGGGQLACMLADAAEALGLPCTVLAQHPDEPAARGRHHVILGDPADPATAAQLARRVTVVAFESENVDVWALHHAGVPILPGPAVMARFADKLEQKRLLAGLDIPTAPFDAWNGVEGAEHWIARVRLAFGGTCVLKWARYGYDGRGVLVLRDAQDTARAAAFVRDGAGRGAAVYAEALVPFRRELALVAVRSARGSFAAWPLVVTEQAAGVCDRVLGPATLHGVPATLDAAARRLAERLAVATGLVGTFALELFETESGALLVNEIAPRVHNSAHWTLDAAVTSQFENHWRALLGLPLGRTRSRAAFAMLNLLGPEAVHADASDAPLPVLAAPARLYWYDKTQVRPGRKMGHINIAAADAMALTPLLAAAERHRAAWADALPRHDRDRAA